MIQSHRFGTPKNRFLIVWTLFLGLLVVPGNSVFASLIPSDFPALKKAYEDSAGEEAVFRLPHIEALGKCEDPAAGRYLADVLAQGGKEKALLEVIVRQLGARGDKVAVEAAVTHGFRVLDEYQWGTIQESFIETMQPDGVEWLTTKGYRVLPRLKPRAQKIVAKLLIATDDPKVGGIGKKLLGNRKIGIAVQPLLVDMIRLHATEGATKSIAKMFRVNDVDLQLSVLRALRDLGAQEHSKVFHEALESRFWEVRSLGADIFGETHDPAVVPVLIPLLEDKYPEVQIATVQALRKIGGRQVVKALIDALESSEAGRVRDDLADTLLWLTGQDYGPDKIAWNTWWKIHGESAEIKGITREEFDRLREESANASTGTYYGLRVISKFVTFIVDVSGSMEEPYIVDLEEKGKKKDGKRGGTGVEPKKGEKGTRKRRQGERKKIEVARSELSRAIGGLPLGTQFNLISFDSIFQPWQASLIEMSDESREEAQAYIQGLKPGGMTNIYDTLMKALEDPSVNTIFFLSDGAPTSGKITDSAAILAAVREANEIRKVKINTIGFHLEPAAEELMRKLAEENYGTFVPR